MRTRWLFLLTSVLVLLVLGGSTPTGAAGVVDPYPPHSGFTCAESSPLPTGVPAIQPHLSTIPAYTAADVQRYFQHMHAQSAMGRVTVLRVLFIPNQDVCAPTRGKHRLCAGNAGLFRRIAGVFYPHTYPPAAHPPPPTLYAYEVFDAQTGNLVLFNG